MPTFESPYPDFAGTTFDDWFEDRVTLERLFARSDSAVEWASNLPPWIATLLRMNRNR